MSKTYLENDLGVSALPSIDKGHKMHPVSKGSSLYLKQTPNSMRFVWRKKGKDIPVGEWANNTLEMLFLIKKANEWMKENPTSDPKSFFNQEQTEEKTFHGAWQEYWEWYTDDVKETTWDDRKNKWKVIFDHFGKNTPLKDFEIANGGKRKIYNFQKKSCFDRQKYSQGKRYRSVMKSFFKYCIQLEWMDSNPAEFAHPDESKIETIRYNRPKRNQHIKWSEVTQLMKSIKKKFGKYNITDLAVKLHLMMSIRSSVIAELRFEWYDPENDNWEIPYTCKGMKKRKGHYYDDDVFIIPSTPEINQIVNHLQSMHRLGWYGFVFPSQVKDKFHKFNHGGYEYNISYNLIKDGRKNKILNKKIKNKIYVTMIHGEKDEVVPVSYSRKILKIFKNANKKLLLVKKGDHSLSSKKNLNKITVELENIISGVI